MLTQHTFIPGKDAALEDSIDRFQQKLTALGFNIEQTSWLNPVPNIWSVHLRDIDCPLCFTNGKGTTQKAALASALGEYFERLSTNYFFADFHLGGDIASGDFVHYPNEKWFSIPADDQLPDGILDAHLHVFYNPENELRASELVDLQSANTGRGICTLPFIRQSDNEVVYIPINIIGNLYVSNGMSAGNTYNEARVQGLAEIFERYVKNRIIAEAISLPEIPPAVLSCYPQVVEAITNLEAEGFPIFAYDASLGGKYPVICVVLFNPANGSCFASFGAHPNFGVALERTVTELLQGRGLNQLDVFAAPSFDHDEIADHGNLETHFIDSSGIISWDMFKQQVDYPFINWSFSHGSTEQELAALMAIFKQQNAEIYIANYEHLGVYTCRIIVPGMSEVYPVDDLFLANNTMAAHFRELILNLPASDWPPEEYLALLARFDKEGLDDFSRVRELIGIACSHNNAWHTLRIGELKALLALAGGDLHQAYDWVEWTQQVNQSSFSDQRSNFYRCLSTLLALLSSDEERSIDNYLIAFNKMYGQQTVDDALQHLTGKKRFYDLFNVDSNLTQLAAHQTLLTAYQKLQVAKQLYWQELG